jgi:two-component system, LytTR family, sensor histidine kinase AlgZ
MLKFGLTGLHRLPNFRMRRMAVRWMLLGNVMGILLTALRLTDPYYAAQEWEELITWIEPAFFLCWLGFAFASPRASVSSAWMLGAYGAWPVFCGFFWTWAMPHLGLVAPLPPIPAACALLLTTAGMLGYWDWRFKALAPSLSERKLQALEARIRPHFLFNTLNALASLVRIDAKQAEEGLLNLADLMREQMRADETQLRTLSSEIELCHRYVAIEKMRFRDRLEVSWDIERAAEGLLVPSLSVQPLLENGLVHGIEAVGKGVIEVKARASEGQLVIEVRNPMPKNAANVRPRGNRYALSNIRERLELLFHGDAHLTAGVETPGCWLSELRLPALTRQPAKAGAQAKIKSALEA